MNWMTSARRRAKLKRGSKNTRSGQPARQDGSLVKHHMVTSMPQSNRNDKKRVKLYNNNDSISRDIMFLRKSPPRQENGKEKKDVIATLDINVCGNDNIPVCLLL